LSLITLITLEVIYLLLQREKTNYLENAMK